MTDLTAALPDFAPYARSATLLRPTAGTPGVRESSIGGPLLWPVEEAWPVCREPRLVEVREALTDEERELWAGIDRRRRERRRRRVSVVGAEDSELMDRIMDGGSLDLASWERVRCEPAGVGDGVPMVPVVQVFARDVPGWEWPGGADVVQVLWCPQDHAEPAGRRFYWGPTVTVRFRSSSDVGAVAEAPRSAGAQGIYVARPCVLDPAEVVDLPAGDEIPEELFERGEAWARARGTEYHRTLACRPGWKVGGWPSWHLTNRMRVDCGVCGAGMRLFLTVDSGGDPGLTVGRFGELRVFVCPADGAHPVGLNIQ
ncbi:hypothetical protein [Streptomyces sp. NBC_01294]|uniref:hypothetical protein n=1 Tax=Streptomyces sp. NBC_01294 TaxID=2903815 RepID=UPI002DDC22E3|nr:hypothetical protein [Streptomyces sp. NBC_01294]WRZ55094.1 hypothetical protein OG534_00250 [Streptomyces sp. NBC_01294]